MLSNKWTFSLTSLVVMLALVFVAPSAMADPFTVTLSVATSADDTAAGNASPDISGVSGDVEVLATAGLVNIRIETGLVVNLAGHCGAGSECCYRPMLVGYLAKGPILTVTAFNSYGGTVEAPDIRRHWAPSRRR